MPDNNDELANHVSKWIKEQGYSLEVMVANAFRRNGFGTAISTWYTDYETKELREIDVVAETYSNIKKNAKVIRVDWHISCKNSSDKPWVIFLSEGQQTEPYFSLTCIGTSSLNELLQEKNSLSKWNGFFENEHLIIPKKRGHGVVQAFSSVDIPYQAMMSAIKSCAHSSQGREEIFDSTTRKRYATLWGVSIPVVVIKGKLFECFIDQHDREHISEVTESCVTGRKIQYGKYLAWPLVHIVTASEINNFAKRAMSASKKLMDVLLKETVSYRLTAVSRGDEKTD